MSEMALAVQDALLALPSEQREVVAAMNMPTRIVVCVGFGIDVYHGVCHANWLENVALLTAEGAFLGATALLERMPEVRLYLDAVDAADLKTSRHPSIVNGSIVSAIEGRFGDYHRNPRSRLPGEHRTRRRLACSRPVVWNLL